MENTTHIKDIITNSNMTLYGFPMQGITRSAILIDSLNIHTALGLLGPELRVSKGGNIHSSVEKRSVNPITTQTVTSATRRV